MVPPLAAVGAWFPTTTRLRLRFNGVGVQSMLNQFSQSIIQCSINSVSQFRRRDLSRVVDYRSGGETFSGPKMDQSPFPPSLVICGPPIGLYGGISAATPRKHSPPWFKNLSSHFIFKRIPLSSIYFVCGGQCDYYHSQSTPNPITLRLLSSGVLAAGLARF